MLEYDLTVADLAAFAAAQAADSGAEPARRERSRVVSAWLVGIGAYLAVALATAVPLLLNDQLALAGLAELAALACGFGLGYRDWRSGGRLTDWLLSRRYRLKAREALSRTGAQRRLSADAAGITVATRDRSELVPWAQVRRVAATADHYFVYTGPGSAHVIPRRAAQAELEAFLALVRANVPFPVEGPR